MIFITGDMHGSHDKIYRKEGRSWWADEMPNETEMESGRNNLEAVFSLPDKITL